MKKNKSHYTIYFNSTLYEELQEIKKTTGISILQILTNGAKKEIEDLKNKFNIKD
jgi:hypothetical protein